MLSMSWSAENDTFPTGAWRFPVLSTRNSILPAFTSLTARATSIVTVPDLGFGMSPRGPRMRPSGPTCPIISGVAITTSTSSHPSLILEMNSAPTKSAPAVSASLAFSPCAITSTRIDLPVPWGSTTVPRTIWSAWRGSTPRFTARSTDSSNFANDAAFTASPASRASYRRARSMVAAADWNFLPATAISPSPRFPWSAPSPRRYASRRRCRRH